MPLPTLDPDAGFALLEASQTYVDPTEHLYDTPGWYPGGGDFYTPAYPLSQYGDRVGGIRRPVFETEVELQQIRGHARIVRDAFPSALGALDNLADYTIGDGFVHTVEAAKGQEPPPGLVEELQDVLDRVHDENDWRADLEREVFQDAKTDGDYGLVLYPDRTGNVVRMRKLEPEQITAPNNPREVMAHVAERGRALPEVSDFAFGVHTPEQDPQDVYGYHVKWNESGTDWEYVPASHMELFKLNVHRATRRGVSDFYPVFGDLVREAKLRRNVAEGAALQAAIAWIFEMPPGTVNPGRAAGRLGDAQSERVVQRPGTQFRDQVRYDGGTILRVKSGQQYKPGPHGAERNAGFEIAAQYLYRAIGVRWRMPEYMVSGDASNANYSSTLVSEAPFVKARETEQRFWASRWRRLAWKILAIAHRQGRFDKYGLSLGRIRRLVKIEITPPPVATRDPVQQAQVDQTYHQMKVKSRETIQDELGLDPETEDARFRDDDLAEFVPVKPVEQVNQPAPRLPSEAPEGADRENQTARAFAEGMAAGMGYLEQAELPFE